VYGAGCRTISEVEMTAALERLWLVSGVGFHVSGFGFRVSGFGFQVSGFGFRVSGFGFWDLRCIQPIRVQG